MGVFGYHGSSDLHRGVYERSRSGGLRLFEPFPSFCLIVMQMNISILGHGKGEVWTRPLLRLWQTTREETNGDTGYCDEVMLAHLPLLSLAFFSDIRVISLAIPSRRKVRGVSSGPPSGPSPSAMKSAGCFRKVRSVTASGGLAGVPPMFPSYTV